MIHYNSGVKVNIRSLDLFDCGFESHLLVLSVRVVTERLIELSKSCMVRILPSVQHTEVVKLVNTSSSDDG